jgi:hypothetical protein
MRTNLAVVFLLVALGGAACGGGDGGNGGEAAPAETAPETAPPQSATGSSEAAEPITVELREADGSGRSGTATLVPRQSGAITTYEVTLEITPPGDELLVAHVHDVTCAEYAEITVQSEQIATVRAPLSDVRDGTSTSTVPGSSTEGGASINVHRSAERFPVVACGDIPGS